MKLTLRRRLVLTAVVVAVPVTIVLFMAIESQRARDRKFALAQFVRSQLTDDTRARCESSPAWFLAGPRDDRPPSDVLNQPDADVKAPRPPVQELPFEYFSYDDQFLGNSSAAPRFPRDLRDQLRRSQADSIVAPFAGAGLQMAVLTKWQGSPCAVLLFRMRPAPDHVLNGTILFIGLLLATLAVALVAGAPTVERIRRLAVAARASAADEYREVVPVSGKDEVSAFAFAFNEAGADIRRRTVDVKDREEMLRRFVANVTDEVAQPLSTIEGRLDSAPSRELHAVTARLHNLVAVVRLRSSTPISREPVDLESLVEQLAGRYAPFARAADVTLAASLPDRAVPVAGDGPLLDRAISNLVDNAIQYNRPGGRVELRLQDDPAARRFSLTIADTGPGVSNDELTGLTAIRRFRGDEGRSRRPGERGLGLAIAREVADRFELALALRHARGGGFEAELSGPVRT